MIPGRFYDTVDEIISDTASRRSTDRTYNLENMSGRIIDGREAARQAVVKILNTERFRYPVYSTDYGIELADLFGMDCNYVCVELERRISEALSVDNRIIRASDFSFTVAKNVVYVSFTVHTVFGDERFRELGFRMSAN
ncbi:MAG: DUF2634 domain-containing protein [Oscillospiraceae bacterium]|nr:DUF2634 domain-containing protein [Oscillospiraceae bacterium]